MAPELLLALTLVAGIESASATARASEEGAPSAAITDTARQVSITLDPTRPLFGMGMVNGEVRFPRVALFPGQPAKDVSLGGWVGVGRMRLADGGAFPGVRPVWSDCGDMFFCDRATVVWVGAQALFYPVGGFDHGLQLGVEASFASLWGTRRYNSFYDALGRSSSGKTSTGTSTDREIQQSGFVPGVVIGYKLVTKAGFTFNPQVAGDLFISGEPARVAPRLALNAGWSF